MSYIYMDNAAATRMDERVLRAMEPYLFERYAVATSEFGYSLGLESREALDASRDTIASSLGAAAEEVVFTSGPTESSNMAIKGALSASRERKGIVTFALEDFDVLHSARRMESLGHPSTTVPSDGTGRIDLEHLKSVIGKDTALVSVQTANQEIGTIQDIRAVAEISHDAGAIVHTDATHAYMRSPVDVDVTGVDLVTISSHTIHGPKGVGALYIREGTRIDKWMDGGFQEFDRRAGAEDIPGIVGFVEAVRLVDEAENDRLRAMRDDLVSRLLDGIPDSELNGHPELRTPQNANVTFHFVEGESITLHLDMRGIAVSTGSACFSRSLESSHVIRGIGGDHERAHGSVRLTLGRFNEKGDVDGVVDALTDVVDRLREISPIARRRGT